MGAVSPAEGCRGWQSPQAGYCEVLIRLFEAFQRRIPASAKKRVRRWREEIGDVVAGSGLYSQTPLPFWRAMAGCIAIGSLATITAWLKKASVKRKKGIFLYLRRYLDAVRVKYRKGNNFINLITHTLQMLKTQPNKELRNKYNSLFGCVVSICSVFLYLFVLWAFAAPAVKLMKMFSWFAGVFSICVCFLKLQRVELSRPPYLFQNRSVPILVPQTLWQKTSVWFWLSCLFD